jgi:hypothetical protein
MIDMLSVPTSSQTRFSTSYQPRAGISVGWFALRSVLAGLLWLPDALECCLPPTAPREERLPLVMATSNNAAPNIHPLTRVGFAGEPRLSICIPAGLLWLMNASRRLAGSNVMMLPLTGWNPEGEGWLPAAGIHRATNCFLETACVP